VRHLFRAEKGGHTGSLDPLATGLLPVCFGEATKIAGGLLGARKAYDTVARLGITTDTDDAEGQPAARAPGAGAVDIDQIDAALRKLTGRIMQRPPIYSALKRGGEPLYVKARRGEAIEVEERDGRGPRLRPAVPPTCWMASSRTAHRRRCVCTSSAAPGTYVRSLVRDLGELLGCGAHVAELRRLWVDPFREPRMWTLPALEDLREHAGERVLEACLLPVEAGMASWPSVRVSEVQAQRLGRGQGLRGPYRPAGQVAVLDEHGRGLGLGEVDGDGGLRPSRLFRWAVATGKPAGATG
jgi:tRNA pseudouridine55 synthase